MRKFLAVAVMAVALTGCAAQNAPVAPSAPSRTAETAVPVTVAPPVISKAVEAPVAPVATEAPVAIPTYVATPDNAPMDTFTVPEAPVYVPVAPVAPVAAPVAPVAVPVAVCHEDEPCWDCKTMGNKICGPVAPEVPTIPPYTDQDSTPPVVSPAPTLEACSEFQTRAEDGSCVRSDFWDDEPTLPIIPPHAEPNPLPEYCLNPELGDAHAGIGLTCQLDQK